MCDALRELMKDDLVKAKNDGRLEGRLEGKFELLADMIETFSLDADKVMDALHIPAEEQEIFRAKLS